jgi:peptide methionine sulfoxide reductase MsrB
MSEKTIFISKFAKHRLYVNGKKYEFNRGLLSVSDPDAVKEIRGCAEFNKNITEISSQKAKEHLEEIKPVIVNDEPRRTEKKDEKKYKSSKK